MKILLDTNVLVSGFVTRGQTFDVVKDALYRHEVYTTDYLLHEFRCALNAKFFELSPRTKDLLAEVVEKYFIRGLTAPKTIPICRDPKDDQVLADALVNGVDLILTGDKDLLYLKIYEGIRILSPKDYWAISK